MKRNPLRWTECQIEGRMCVIGQDMDGEPVAKYARPATEPRLPGAQVTSPAPGRSGWKVDWMWLKLSVLSVLTVAFLCVAAAACLTL